MSYSNDTPVTTPMHAEALQHRLPRTRLPEIGARTTLAEVLRMLGHKSAAEIAAFKHDFTNRRLHRGQRLVAAGDRLESLYVVLSGSFRSILHEVDGSQRAVAFPMRGDLIGLDAIGPGCYPVTVSALEEAYAAAIPHAELLELTSRCPAVMHAILAASAAGLLDSYDALRTMGALGAEARVAHFLRVTGQRFARFGLSQQTFRLTMTRADIAGFLGLSIETVSRAFTSLAARGLLEVDRRQIRILDRGRLDDPAQFEPHSLQAQGRARALAKAHRPAARLVAL